MKYRFSLKTWLLSFLARLKGKTKKGTMTLISIFIYFLFTTIGLSLIFLSQVYSKISFYRKNNLILEYTAENGIKQGFDRLVQQASSQNFPLHLSQEQVDDFKKNCQNGGTKIAEEVLVTVFPLIIKDSWQDQRWSSSIDSFMEKMAEEENYFLSDYKVTIISEGSRTGFIPKKRAALDSSLKILAGRLPLPFFPLLIDKKLDQEDKENFKEKNNINFIFPTGNPLSMPLSITENELIPDEANSLLIKALKIRNISRQNLTRLELREALGLEIIDEPVPDGVYLVKDDSELGGIYIQGDVEEMILAVESDFQVISVRMRESIWVLKFSPAQNETTFITPTETICSSSVPLGIIVVSGKISSLGGGIINSSGQPVLVYDEEIASLLQGLSLTIVSSDKITLTSHLFQQGLRWQEELPYLKGPASQFVLFTTGRDFWSGEEREGKIVIGESSPQDIKIQAALTAKRGFSMEGERKSVYLVGSLQTSDFESGTNSLKIAFDPKLLEGNSFSENSPLTTSPVLYLLSLKPVEWKELR